MTRTSARFFPDGFARAAYIVGVSRFVAAGAHIAAWIAQGRTI
jgi:hypothetical protein